MNAIRAAYMLKLLYEFILSRYAVV